MKKKIIIAVVLVGTLTIVGIVYRYQQTYYRNNGTGSIVATSTQTSNTTVISSSLIEPAASSSVSTSSKSGLIIVNVGHLSDNPAVSGQFGIPDLHMGNRVELQWESDSNTRDYGNEAQICLHAFDARGILIHSRLDHGLCVYGGYSIYSDLQSSGALGTTTVSSGYYDIIVEPKWESLFVSKPTSYKLSVFVVDELPSEGRSEWAGLISSMSSTLFIVR